MFRSLLIINKWAQWKRKGNVEKGIEESIEEKDPGEVWGGVENRWKWERLI